MQIYFLYKKKELKKMDGKILGEVAKIQSLLLSMYIYVYQALPD